MQRDEPHGSTPIDSALIWIPLWINPSIAEPTRGLLDTSVAVDHDLVDPALVPGESAAAGLHATRDE
jgi:hypothetical protein